MTDSEKILRAFTDVLQIFGWEHESPDVQRCINACHGADQAALVIVQWGDLTRLSREVSLAFGLCVSVEISVEVDLLQADRKLGVLVSWPAGGGEVSSALAEVSLHMEWVQKAAQARYVLWDAVGSMSSNEVLLALGELEARSSVLWGTLQKKMALDRQPELAWVSHGKVQR